MPELGVNKVVLIGRSGGDAELRYTAGGKPVANFSLAVNESFRSRDGEKKDHLEWFPCVCWNKLGEIAGQYVTKGKLVFVEGRLQTRRYDDSEGNARKVTEVVVTQLRLLSGNSSGNGNGKFERGEAPKVSREGAVPRPWNRKIRWTIASRFDEVVPPAFAAGPGGAAGLLGYGSFRLRIRIQGAVEAFLSSSEGFVKPPLQDFSWRQFRQVLGDSNAAPLELQQFDVVIRLAGAKDETQRRLFSGLTFALFEPTEIEFHLSFVRGAEAA